MRKLALLTVIFGLAGVLLTGGAAATLTTPAGTGGLNSDADIPAELVPIIEAAASAYCDLRPALLAAILKAESDLGRSLRPGVRSGANDAGAAGPMQIGIGGKAGNTWGGAPIRQVPPDIPYGIDGNGDAIASVYDPADAIHGAARYLCALGGDDEATLVIAVASYHCGPTCGQGDPAAWGPRTKSYVTKVLAAARSYEAGLSGPVAAIPPGFGTPGPCGRSPATDYARWLTLQTFGQLTIGDCAYRGHVENSDHYPDANGQAHALDIMVGGDKPLGDRIAGWLTQHHQALNIKQIIWYGQVIDYRDANPAWRACRDPNSSCAKNHFGHVHEGFRL
jgi:hypothetical protein